MANHESFIKRHAVLAYYALTFAISSGAIFMVIAIKGIPATQEQLNMVLPVGIVAMLAGPSFSCLLLTGLVDGKAGFRELRARLLKWQVGGWYYILALLAAPLLLVASLVALSLIFPGYPPSIFAVEDKASLLLMGSLSGFFVGICEEVGWVGFAQPRLRLHYRLLTTGLIMGVLWGVWHIPSHAVLASGAYSAPFTPTIYVIARGLTLGLGPLVPFRVLYVWMYDRTGSLPLTMVMHFSQTASTIILQPFAISGVPLLISDFLTAAVLWVFVAAIAAANGGRLERDLASQAN